MYARTTVACMSHEVRVKLFLAICFGKSSVLILRAHLQECRCPGYRQTYVYFMYMHTSTHTTALCYLLPPCMAAVCFARLQQLDLLRLSTGTQSRVVTACTMLKRMLFRYQVCSYVPAPAKLGCPCVVG